MTHLKDPLSGISVENTSRMTILRSTTGKSFRRVLYLNSYGMANALSYIRDGSGPGQHLWGCLELARAGYEVAMPAEPRTDSRFFNYRRQDLKHLRFMLSWLGREGIVYSAHTVLFWSPLLASLGILRNPIITLLYARGENLRFRRGYHGILALTPAAADRARQLVPAAKVAHISWGVDLPYFAPQSYRPDWFLSCGKTRRDFATLGKAAAACSAPVHVINTELPKEIVWPPNVRQITGGNDGSWVTVSHRDLVEQHYAGSSAALIIIENDPVERYAAGFTQLLEAMALAKPVIVSRTGAIAGELNVESTGCGIGVASGDPGALADAMRTITENPSQAAAMGVRGRRICEERYDIIRYARDLHAFFEAF